MIGHCGYFGAGKTMAMTQFLLQKLKNPRNIVIANYRIEGAHLYIPSFEDFMDFLAFLYDAQTRKEPRLRGKNIFIGIDEASVWFDSRNFKSFPENLKAFIRQLRKLRTEIHFTTQSANTVDVGFRRLTEYWIYHTRPLYWMDQDVEIFDESGKVVVDVVKIPRWFNVYGYSHKWILNPENAIPDPSAGAEYLGRDGFYKMCSKTHRMYDSTEIVLKDTGGLGGRSKSVQPSVWLDRMMPQRHNAVEIAPPMFSPSSPPTIEKKPRGFLTALFRDCSGSVKRFLKISKPKKIGMNFSRKKISESSPLIKGEPKKKRNFFFTPL